MFALQRYVLGRSVPHFLVQASAQRVLNDIQRWPEKQLFCLPDENRHDFATVEHVCNMSACFAVYYVCCISCYCYHDLVK